ncbi:unnamed protein product [Vitrella brassicaformis CCMP3155]|uniref:JmjC domain-containing protein n=1 Tax=Vitrella brassicaformis (strain CCMP3155) TaxID=1169540 RepID=A0A0G4EH09_VITBC|nr:unnamed protein product [Vitrella brassicaformis CCMP3155]|eukprot:CEL94654.1 unnamed protein product [Vitrella brassicaformis CCMP3155]
MTLSKAAVRCPSCVLLAGLFIGIGWVAVPSLLLALRPAGLHVCDHTNTNTSALHQHTATHGNFTLVAGRRFRLLQASRCGSAELLRGAEVVLVSLSAMRPLSEDDLVRTALQPEKDAGKEECLFPLARVEADQEECSVCLDRLEPVHTILPPSSVPPSGCIPVRMKGLQSLMPAGQWTPAFLRRLGAARNVTLDAFSEPSSVNGSTKLDIQRAITLDQAFSAGNGTHEGGGGRWLDVREDIEVFNQLPGLRRHLHWRLAMPTHFAASLVEYLWIAPKGSITPLHMDLAAPHIFHYIIAGKKTFWLYPYSQSDLLTPTGTMPLDGALYSNMVPHDAPANNGSADVSVVPSSAAPLKITLSAGESLYIPWGWWHYVHYDQDSLSVNVVGFDSDVRTSVWYSVLAVGVVLQGIKALCAGDWATVS